MSESLAQLRSLSDADVVRMHDEAARNTSVGVQFYLDELDRRAAHRSARATTGLSIVTAVVSVAALIVAVLSLLRT